MPNEQLFEHPLVTDALNEAAGNHAERTGAEGQLPILVVGK